MCHLIKRVRPNYCDFGCTTGKYAGSCTVNELHQRFASDSVANRSPVRGKHDHLCRRRQKITATGTVGPQAISIMRKQVGLIGVSPIPSQMSTRIFSREISPHLSRAEHIFRLHSAKIPSIGESNTVPRSDGRLKSKLRWKEHITNHVTKGNSIILYGSSAETWPLHPKKLSI